MKKEAEILNAPENIPKKEAISEAHPGPKPESPSPIHEKPNEQARKGFFSMFRKNSKAELLKESQNPKKSWPDEKSFAKAKKIEEERKKIRKHLLRYYLLKSGFDTSPEELRDKIITFSGLGALFVSIVYSIYIVSMGTSIPMGLLVFLSMLVIGFIFIFLMAFLSVFLFLDILMYKRKNEIESVLADFLQLTSANVHAGMTLDKALWFAIRPRFGMLAKEIEMIAKETASGTSLEVSLRKFASRYNSNVLKSSVSLIIEGLEAGGEMGPLLSRISTNIKENQLMMREMAANVSTYVIFITSATIFAAPLLMALSYQLLLVVSKLSSTLEMPSAESAMGTLPVAFSKVSITAPEFRTFALLCLGVTAFFSAMIVSIIKSGDIRAGVKNIFVFIIGTTVMFMIMSYGLRGVFSSFI
ncbi:MAG: type II secretion system F family protein [Candidatus Woesearchaeota archaeon]|nr:type II secretion system F family protein [Candidatus Woesearchaeota archaeon]